MSREKCVWVHEIAVLDESGKGVAYWAICSTSYSGTMQSSAHNTRKDAIYELRKEFKKRPHWVTAKFHRMTNRIRKYVPEKS
jgi:hypothetical protein